jgi:hypothetical protein
MALRFFIRPAIDKMVRPPFETQAGALVFIVRAMMWINMGEEEGYCRLSTSYWSYEEEMLGTYRL